MIVLDLNQMRNKNSRDFYIKYDRNQDYTKNNSYLIVGKVTLSDWEELNLDMDFMTI